MENIPSFLLRAKIRGYSFQNIVLQCSFAIHIIAFNLHFYLKANEKTSIAVLLVNLRVSLLTNIIASSSMETTYICYSSYSCADWGTTAQRQNSISQPTKGLCLHKLRRQIILPEISCILKKI